MSRSAADATRFTATSPHAYSAPSPKPPSAGSPNPQSSPPRKPPNLAHNTPPLRKFQETPQEKVARLRAARFAARDAQLTTFERVVLVGRIWADRAHKVFTLSLIGFTVLAGGVAAFALTDMILHNRRKRSAFYAEQHATYNTRLLAAIETERAGLPLTSDQTLVLNRERAKIAAEEEKKRGSWSEKVKGVFVGGLKGEIEGGGVAVAAGDATTAGVEGGRVLTEAEVLERVGVDQMKVLVQAEAKARTGHARESPVLEAVREQQQRVDGKTAVKGGLLDQMAENVAEDLKSKGRGWFGWGRRG